MAHRHVDEDRSVPPGSTKINEALEGGDGTSSRDDPQPNGSGGTRPGKGKCRRSGDLYRKAQSVVDEPGDRAIASKEVATKKTLQLIGHDCGAKRQGQAIELGIGKQPSGKSSAGPGHRTEHHAGYHLLRENRVIVAIAVGLRLLGPNIEHGLDDRGGLQRRQEFDEHPGQGEATVLKKSEGANQQDASQEIGAACQNLVKSGKVPHPLRCQPQQCCTDSVFHTSSTPADSGLYTAATDQACTA